MHFESHLGVCLSRWLLLSQSPGLYVETLGAPDARVATGVV